MKQRFGEEGVRAMLRAEGRPGAVTESSVKPEQRPELDHVAGMTAILKQGERAAANVAQRQAESERQGQRRGCGCKGRFAGHPTRPAFPGSERPARYRLDVGEDALARRVARPA